MKKIFYFISLLALATACENKHTETSSKSDKDTSSRESYTRPEGINKDSCPDGFYIKHAHAYNNFIIDNQAYIVEKNLQFVDAIEKGNSDSLAGIYKALTDQTQQSIDSVQKLCAFNGNAEFKDAAADLFKFYKDAWGEYKELAELKDKKEMSKAIEKVKTRINDFHSKKEKELENKFVKAHTNFTNEYMLHVRTTPMHEKMDSILYGQEMTH